MFGSRQLLAKCITTSLSVCDVDIPKSDCIQYLGSWMGQFLSFKKHIEIKCRPAMLTFYKIKSIRYMISTEACVTLTLGLILFHLDYANAILIGFPNIDLHNMQRVQNITAKLVLGADKLTNPKQCVMQLHWLPIEARIKHKILTLIWKHLNGIATMYLQNLLTLNPCYRPGP